MSTKDLKIDAAIKSGNNKLALRLVQEKIKQHPNSSYFYALQAQILALSNDIDNAVVKAKELLDKFPSDPETLKILISVFELCEYDSEDVFEKVCKKYPTFNLIYERFNHSINTCDLNGIQKSTMALTKAIMGGTVVDQRMLKFWACFSLVLVCFACKETLKAPLLKLYPQMGLRLIDKIKPANAQEQYVYSRLLQLAGKDEENASSLKEFLKKENDLELKLMYFECLENLGYWHDLSEICNKYLVELKEDDWDTWKLYIKASSKNDKLEECVAIIKSYPVTRNSQLALIELTKYDLTMSFNECFLNYVQKYGHKLCCFLDLKIFIKPGDLLFEILESEFEKRKIPDILNKKQNPTENDLVFMVNYLKFKAYLCQDVFKSPEFIKQCCFFYSSTKPLLTNLVKFEYFAGFEFIILALQSLIVQSDELSTELLIKLTIVLENALSKNPYEFHLKLWLIKLYSKLNLISESTELFKSLKIKFIQLDTISHVLNTRLSTLTTQNETLFTLSNFYTQHADTELPAMVSNCFQEQSYNKLQSFIEFQLRLQNSYTKYTNVVELIKTNRILDDQSTIDDDLRPLLKKYYKTESQDKICQISDNRDMTTFWNCGIHETIKAVSDKLNTVNPELTSSYTRLMIVKELIIYDTSSKYHSAYVTEFLQLYSSVGSESLTSLEKWNLSIIAELVDPTSTVKAIDIISPPKSTLNFNFNHYYFTLVDVSKQIKYILSNTKKGTFSSDKIKNLKSLATELNSRIKSFREDVLEFKRISKREIQSLKGDVSTWFKNDDLGSLFEIDQDFMTGCFEKYDNAIGSSLLSLRKI
ncbi:hypothetical protein CANARDRAFT_5455 [[Candida] arabinofermentans NRRL YB-2248]|uniref:N-terminal acetyltransferase B complex subunit MDM20 n=1 Tax=[Candida] arabinofermentans NRRL YB-2248 TaxID=983967 RepID=A0A1E4T8R5_9ASCO|nr:hypothetical protein CANARDRAFT_5455 [[Candida] arabinofermentans NRRL YB-2248]